MASSTSKKTTSSRSTSRSRKAAPKPVSNSPFRRALPFTIFIVLGVVLALFYVILDTKIERQAKKVVDVEDEIRSAQHAYTAELNAWERTLQPANLEHTMNHLGLDMRFPPKSQQILLSRHDDWMQRQTARGTVTSVDPLPPPPDWARRFLPVSAR